MTIGWDDVQRMKRVEAKANELGFMFATGRYIFGNEPISYICLKPKDDGLPHYSRDAEIFTGTLDDIDVWLRGIEWARNYDEMIKLSNNKKRVEKEQLERNRQLMRTLKTGQLVQGHQGSPDSFLEDAYDQFVDEDEIPF